MGKEARIWKIYVKEADKWDTELIDGWNRSLDMILVFAALFSAISSAFIIESSNMLTQDTNTATVNALLAISQNLATIAAVPGSTSTSSFASTALAPDLVPPHHAVIINTLWYFSLSLSVATSLLSMLAKDWCYSFGANRTGHSWDQALRRQRKWTMIEQWKMQELINVLPFFIHSSLLLFAIGLCIYVWDLNQTVAIPVICVTSIASAFYIWSSIMASIVKLFPYTTILSRVMQSEFMHSKYKLAKQYGKVCISSVLGALFIAASGCLYAICWVATAIFFLLQLPIVAVHHIWHKPEDPDRTKSFLHKLKKLISGGIRPKMHGWLNNARRNVSEFPRPWGPRESDHEQVASLALRWLIENCENAASVDAALQAIAGASARIPKEPLESCRAALHIVRRLAADPDTEEAERNNKLYTRALTILGSDPKATKGTKRSKDNLSSAEVSLRNFQPEHQRQIDDLITSTDFSPTAHNLDALSTGSIAASLSFRLLKGEDTDAPDIFAKLTGLLLEHIGSSVKQLNSAALRSLTNTTVLLASCSSASLFSPADMDRCMRSCLELISSGPATPHMESVLDACTAFLVSLALHNALDIEEAEQPSCITTDTRVERATSFLSNQHSRDYSAKSAFYHIAIIEILLSWSSHEDIKTSEEIIAKKDKLDLAYLREALKMPEDTSGRRRAADISKQQIAISQFLTAVEQVCKLTAHSEDCVSSNVVSLSPPVYCLFVWATCLSRFDKDQNVCDKLLSNLMFPNLTAEFTTAVDQILPVLWATYKGEGLGLGSGSQTWRFSTARLWQIEGANGDWLAIRPKHFAATQLWILISLVGTSSGHEQKRLKEILARHTGQDLGELGILALKRELENRIMTDYRDDHCIEVYTARIIGCILEGRDDEAGVADSRPATVNQSETNSGVIHRVRRQLLSVPSALQGLASFTDKPRATQPARPFANRESSKGRFHRWSKGTALLAGLRKKARVGGVGSHSALSLRSGSHPLEVQDNPDSFAQTDFMEEPEQMTAGDRPFSDHVAIPILPIEPSSGGNHPPEK
ncbi:hypothetical protein BN14_06144 [Rhizoctonia solani AG-1 IB]|uniref:DUF6535 domain-containing protein n=1 Tax=Thanatephorus cucumeris (strain AG1-IB / isolate 7/3/14) TaxID=1108050 RepID=M5BY38_THACB|nr:hypothetical protein BN14_06144 [Rhizoctonia solani AG-1 IB]